eukprot:jgi/Botrbrau1/3869/Bobra.0183s0093.1
MAKSEGHNEPCTPPNVGIALDEQCTLLWREDLDNGAAHEDLPLPIRVGLSVETYDSAVQRELQYALELLWAHATSSKDASPGPVLIKGAAAHWPAIHLWSLGLACT